MLFSSTTLVLVTEKNNYFVNQCYQCDHMKGGEMGVPFSRHVRDEKCVLARSERKTELWDTDVGIDRRTDRKESRLNNKREAYEITSLAACSSLITFAPIDVHEIQHGDHAIEGNLGAMIFYPIPSTIFKWPRFKLLRWMKNLHQSALDYQGLSSVTILGLHRNPLLWNSGCHCWVTVGPRVPSVVNNKTWEHIRVTTT
jgi:hypothetical protein